MRLYVLKSEFILIWRLPWGQRKAVLARHRLLWMCIEEQNRACQWPMVHVDWKAFILVGTGAVTAHRLPALVSESVPYLSKAENCCFVSPVNTYLFLQKACLLAESLSGVQPWCIYYHQAHSSDIPRIHFAEAQC